MNDKIRKIVLVIGILITVGGIIGILYPFVGNYVNSLSHKKIVRSYQAEVETMEETDVKRLLSEATEYNIRLFHRGGKIINLSDEQLAEYNNMLNMSVTTIMGYIEIPKINIFLPIYHGTSESVLQAGIGHLEGSSLPIGGSDTNAVLTGHSGLPSDKMFTDLDQLSVGDTFTITVLDNVITYEVDGTEVRLPEDVNLSIEAGKDVCTLITCTPIGVNTHRLIVHAHRIPNKTIVTHHQPITDEDDNPTHTYIILPVIIVVFLLILLFFIFILKKFKSRY